MGTRNAEAAVERLEVELEGADADTSLELLYAGVLEVNIELEDEDARIADRERIATVVRRLSHVAKSVAGAVGAEGYSVTVGIPLGVSVAIEWKVRD